MKTKLFIDFDDTLFNRNKFRDDLFKIFEELGFTKEDLEKSYKAVYKDGYDGAIAQLDYLHQNVKKFDLKAAKKKVNEFLSNLESYLYEEAIPFLKAIDKKKYEINLITVGGIDFQKSKVVGAKVGEYFDNMYFTLQEKKEKLSEFLEKSASFILLDDKEKEVGNVRKYFPNAKTIQVVKGKLNQYLKELEL